MYSAQLYDSLKDSNLKFKSVINVAIKQLDIFKLILDAEQKNELKEYFDRGKLLFT